MANIITSLKELEQELNKKILRSMNEVGQKGKDVVKEQLDVSVYKAYSPTTYVRTYDLKNSVTKDVYQVGTFTSASIFHDKDMIKGVPAQYKNNYTGQHYSTGEYYLKDYSYFVPSTVNDGTSGHIFGSGKWTRSRPYFTKAEKIMNKTFKSTLKSELTKQGLKVK